MRVRSAALLAVSLNAASASAQPRPASTLFIASDVGVARPSCNDCEDPVLGPHLGVAVLGPLGPHFGAGMGIDYASFAYAAEAGEPRVGAYTWAVPFLIRSIPVRERLIEPCLELGLGLMGSNATDGDGKHGPVVRGGIGVGVRADRALTIGPYLRWVGVLSGSVSTCSEAGCYTSPRHVGFAAFGVSATYTPALR